MPKKLKYVLPGRGIDDACSVGDLNQVRKIMDDKEGGGAATGLLTAATWGRADVVEVLLGEYGVGVDEQAVGGYTALMCAAKNGKGGVVEVLVAHGADLRVFDEKMMTAEDHALAMGHNYIVNMLRNASKGTDPPTAEEALDTLNLHYLKRAAHEGTWKVDLKSFLTICKKSRAPTNPRLAILKWMLALDPTLATTPLPPSELPPLILAATSGDTTLIKLLFEHGTTPLPTGADPAAVAAQNGFTHASNILALAAAEKSLEDILEQKAEVPSDPEDRADWVAKLRTAKQTVAKCKQALEGQP